MGAAGASARAPGLARAAAFALYAYLVARTAWIADDAYISFRTIENFVAGDGLRWNLVERVQSFTHPLWLLLLSGAHALGFDLYFVTIAISVALSLVTAFLVGYRLAPSAATGALAVALLGASRSFVDYSTSGLENPLSHLLLVVLILVWLRRDRSLLVLGLLAGLGALNRLDTVLVSAPILVHAWWERRGLRGAVALAAGFLPLLAWELFSIVYYGFPFPNTYYAKLPADLPRGVVLGHGGDALIGSAILDPLLAVVLLGGAVVALAPRGRRALWPLAAGIALQIGYVVWIGGDFMAGRFFTVAYCLGVTAIVRGVPWPAESAAAALAAAAVLIGLLPGARASLVTGADYGTAWHWTKNIDARGIADERAVYYKITGLFRADRPFARPHHFWFDRGAAMRSGDVTIGAALGFTGYAAPRDTTIIDQLGLCDPLLARLPAENPRHWRPGHIGRTLPKGYVETRRTGRPQIADPDVARLYAELVLVTQGPIWSAERLRSIWDLNTR